ncbi:enoyl-CoA hydratase/isomerase family protein [Pigmentiphaga aceris]|uniref:enoyl-CoA hydratase/isomerase family protein n=1 Tax=Pigmentiphaga aceris TaxID=1940612 RepID=UPI001FEB92D5|nr:enoyl-CoA hydratase-related protein [Pigmentiphaga aceris]
MARLTFNRPAVLNALDGAMASAWQAALQTVRDTAGLRVLVMRGAGRAFMAGGDLGALQQDPVAKVQALLPVAHDCVRIITDLQIPVVASLHGAVAGAGVSIALAADLAIAAENTQFTLAYARIGASPDVGATWHLPQVVGLRKAMEIAMLADTLDAQEALRLSLVNRVVPTNALEAETDALVQRLANGPTAAYAKIRHLLRDAGQRSLSAQLDAEQAAFEASAATEDFQEGVAAFLGKRPAKYTGR